MDQRGKKLKEAGKVYVVRSFTLYTSHHLLRRIRWAGCVVQVRKRKNTYYFFLEHVKEQDCLVVVDTDGRIILKLAFDEKHGNMWTGFMRPRVGISGRMF